MMEYHRPQLKQAAKIAMARTRPKAWLVTVVFLLLCMIVTGLFSFLSPKPFEGLAEPLSEALEEAVDHISGTGDLDRALEKFQHVLEGELWSDFLEYGAGAVSSSDYGNFSAGFLFHLLAGSVLAGLAASLLSTIASLINVVIDHGYRSYCLGVFRRENPSIGTLFSAFPCALTVLGTHIVVSIFVFLWTMLAIAVGGGLILLTISILPPAAAAVVSMIFYLAAVFMVLTFALQYALVPYIVVERRELGVFEAIRYSKELMKKNVMRLLVLELSFLGWILLIGLIIGGIVLVGVLFASLLISVTRMVIIGAAVMGVAIIAAFLVPLPLELWLTTYRNIALAGFYHVVSFPDEEEPVMEETLVMTPVAAGGSAVPDAPVWANAPEEEILPPREEIAQEESAEEAAPEETGEQTPAEEPQAPEESVEGPTTEEPEEAPEEETSEEENKE